MIDNELSTVCAEYTVDHQHEGVVFVACLVGDGVVIHKITVFGDQNADEQQIQGPLGLDNIKSGDFMVVISVPVFDSSARVQGEQIIRNLSRSSGLNLRLTEHNKETVTSNEVEREYWRYVMVGSKPSAI